MELVAGRSLHSALQCGAAEARRVIEIASQIADGLAVAHAAGNRPPRSEAAQHHADDGRPREDRGFRSRQDQPAGAGRRGSDRYGGGLTDTFVVVGTAGYMAPEQVTSKPIDFRADQFALGAIIYEMITGRRAFKRETPVQTMAAIVDTEPELIAELAGTRQSSS